MPKLLSWWGHKNIKHNKGLSYLENLCSASSSGANLIVRFASSAGWSASMVSGFTVKRSE